MGLISFDNKIIILNDNAKDDFILSFKNLVNFKIITLSELKKKYYFDYTNETIYYVSKKYNVIYDVAKIYIDNLYYIDEEINNEKVKFLFNLKQDLIDNNLLIFNKLFNKFLTNKNIILYNLKYVDKFYNKIINKLKEKNNIEEINYNANYINKTIYEANNIEEEVVFVASNICKLINDGISINNIKLANVSSDYYFYINKIFKQFKIPVNLKSHESIKGTLIVKKFKELFCDDIESVITNLKKYIKTNKDEELLNQIINVVNSYYWCNNYEDVKEFIFHDIDNLKIKKRKYKNAVELINIEDYPLCDDYIFVINFNEGVIPNNIMNEDYLNDSTKTKLGISTSSELNNINEIKIKEKLLMLNNIIITYCNSDSKGEKYISNLYDNKYFKVEKVKIDYCYSNSFNKIKLVSEKDANRKYGEISEDLKLLSNSYKNEKYLFYDNSYKEIDKTKLFEYMNKHLTLSYSTMNTYYKCGFRYYLDNVLKLNKFEDSFQIIIGNIFHEILSVAFNDGFEFDKEWNSQIEKYEFNNMEKFFIKKLKWELILVIDTIKNQLKYTQLSKSMYEKEIIININPNLNITFKGFVDKILYDNIDDMNVCAIIDYKTGNPKLNINNSIYGLDMQLPIYIYLIKNSNIIDNVKVGGFYLQKILNTSLDIEERINSLKLQGYSNSNLDILEKVDTSYNDSKIIKSLKYTDNGFYRYSKVLSDNEIDYLSNIVSSKVVEASNDIINARFDINPKQIGEDNIGCTYCKYKDICYMKNADIVTLKKIDNVFGGDNNGNLD